MYCEMSRILGGFSPNIGDNNLLTVLLEYCTPRVLYSWTVINNTQIKIAVVSTYIQFAVHSLRLLPWVGGVLWVS
jgi:hypothetical protein